MTRTAVDNAEFPRSTGEVAVLTTEQLERGIPTHIPETTRIYITIADYVRWRLQADHNMLVPELPPSVTVVDFGHNGALLPLSRWSLDPVEAENLRTCWYRDRDQPAQGRPVAAPPAFGLLTFLLAEYLAQSPEVTRVSIYCRRGFLRPLERMLRSPSIRTGAPFLSPQVHTVNIVENDLQEIRGGEPTGSAWPKAGQSSPVTIWDTNAEYADRGEQKFFLGPAVAFEVMKHIIWPPHGTPDAAHWRRRLAEIRAWCRTSDGFVQGPLGHAARGYAIAGRWEACADGDDCYMDQLILTSCLSGLEQAPLRRIRTNDRQFVLLAEQHGVVVH